MREILNGEERMVKREISEVDFFEESEANDGAEGRDEGDENEKHNDRERTGNMVCRWNRAKPLLLFWRSLGLRARQRRSFQTERKGERQDLGFGRFFSQ